MRSTAFKSLTRSDASQSPESSNSIKTRFSFAAREGGSAVATTPPQGSLRCRTSHNHANSSKPTQQDILSPHRADGRNPPLYLPATKLRGPHRTDSASERLNRLNDHHPL